MQVLVAGASGLIGTELVRRLGAEGHDVLRLVRREPQGTDERSWTPSARTIDVALLDGADAVVNLSGASLNRLPWTPAHRRRILASRLEATGTLAEAMRRIHNGESVSALFDNPDDAPNLGTTESLPIVASEPKR